MPWTFIKLARIFAIAAGLSAIIGAASAVAQPVDPAVEDVDEAVGETGDDTTRWSTRARWGLEYDDNPYRLEGYDESGDALSRYLVGVDILTDLDPSGQVSASVRHGGKIFLRERDASAWLTELNASGSWRVHRRLGLQATVDVKDRTERAEERDYNRGGAGLRLRGYFGPLQAWVGPRFRYFAFKPSSSSSNTGPHIQAGLRWMIRNDLAATGSYSHLWRRYSSPAWQVVDNNFVPYSDGRKRNDEYDLWQLSLHYQRAISAHLKYQYARNHSNSFGQGLQRHSLAASLTTPLFWEVFLSGRAEVQRTRYEDRVLIDDVFILDEDNRNTIVAALGRPLGENWEVELRYTIFAQEFGTDGQYRRQILGLTLGYFLDER